MDEGDEKKATLQELERQVLELHDRFNDFESNNEEMPKGESSEVEHSKQEDSKQENTPNIETQPIAENSQQDLTLNPEEAEVDPDVIICKRWNPNSWINNLIYSAAHCYAIDPTLQV